MVRWSAIASSVTFGVCVWGYETPVTRAASPGFVSATSDNVRSKWLTQSYSAFLQVHEGGTGHVLPRGGDSIHAGLPACDDAGTCDTALTIAGSYSNACPGSDKNGWISLAFPIQTNGEIITAVNLVHIINVSGGHLYVLGDCGGNPDINDIIYSGCNAVLPGSTGAQTYLIDPPVATGSTIWVVTAMSSAASFDVAFNDSISGPGLGYGNLSASGDCGNWVDLDALQSGYCFCVSVDVGEPLPSCCSVENQPQCDGDANGDGSVDPLDAGFTLARFGEDVAEPNNCSADVNCDGVIDPLDSGYILARFGTCNPGDNCAVGGGRECDADSLPLSNDDCDRAAEVTGVMLFDTSSATTDGPSDCDPFTGKYDLWYQYTSPGAGNAIITLCSGTSYDSTLSVYSGTSCPVGAPLACGDDSCDVPGGPSEVTVTVAAGQKLLIRVGGWDDGSGQAESTGVGQLSVTFASAGQGACCFADESCSVYSSSTLCSGSGGVFQGFGTTCTAGLCESAPSNDYCNDVEPIVLEMGGSLSFTGDNTGASSDCDLWGVPELWHVFSIDQSADIQLDYCGTGETFEPVFVVLFDSCPCNESFVVADTFPFETCSGGDFNVHMEYFELPAGTWYIPVYANPADGTLGEYTINVSRP